MNAIHTHLGTDAETAELRESFRQLAAAQSDICGRFHKACGVTGSNLPLRMLDTLNALGHTDAMSWLQYQDGRSYKENAYAHPALDRYIGHGTANQVQEFIKRMPPALQREVMGNHYFLRNPHIEYRRSFGSNPYPAIATVVSLAYEAAGLGDLKQHDVDQAFSLNKEFTFAGMAAANGNLVRLEELKELGFTFDTTKPGHLEGRPAWVQGLGNYNYWADIQREHHPEEQLASVRVAINFARQQVGERDLFEYPNLPTDEQPHYVWDAKGKRVQERARCTRVEI